MNTTDALSWAFATTGLDPAAKLVLILTANVANQDGRLFEPYDELRAAANLTEDGFTAAVENLRVAGLAGFAIDDRPDTGERVGCIILNAGE